ncbi:MAG: hypothetical protein AAF961_11145, partial [Planctomycetota bacterium]
MLQAVARTLTQPELEPAAEILAQSLRDVLGCRWLALAAVDQQRRRSRILACSDGRRPSQRAAQASLIEQ